jgi:hypothetical protein
VDATAPFIDAVQCDRILPSGANPLARIGRFDGVSA